MLGHIALQVIADPIGVPHRRVQQPLQPIRGLMTDVLGDMGGVGGHVRTATVEESTLVRLRCQDPSGNPGGRPPHPQMCGTWAWRGGLG